ncbi:DUF4129 domain-containing protein [Pedococcus bigeumensis]|nr:DUF4129 domain-containing protein [Pedococcus bigeumensis]
MTCLTAPFDGPPLDPSSPEAQQWVRDELANGQYLTEPSWWQRFVEWLSHLFGGGSSPSLLPSWVAVLVVVVVVAVVALVVLRLVRPESVTRRRPTAVAAVDDEGLSAADYRRRARASSDRGDWDTALLDSYRALAASAVERTLLTELPGRTAHEVAVSLGPVFPDHAEALASAASSFDDVRYGHRRTTRAQAAATTELDAELLQTKPRLGQVVAR